MCLWDSLLPESDRRAIVAYLATYGRFREYPDLCEQDGGLLNMDEGILTSYLWFLSNLLDLFDADKNPCRRSKRSQGPSQAENFSTRPNFTHLLHTQRPLSPILWHLCRLTDEKSSLRAVLKPRLPRNVFFFETIGLRSDSS